jgi:hypothetical protein
MFLELEVVVKHAGRMKRIWETDKGSIPVLACLTASNRAGAQKPYLIVLAQSTEFTFSD